MISDGDDSVTWSISLGLLFGLLVGAIALFSGVGLGAAGAIGLISGLAGIGLGLLRTASDGKKQLGSLGAGLVVSAVIGAALALAQFELNRRLDAAQEKNSAQVRAADRMREAQAERRNLALLVGLQRDLQGIDLAGRDLRGIYLGKKQLRDANLARVKLDKAVLTDANLRGANLKQAHLRGALLGGQDRELNPNSFTTVGGGADITGADFTAADIRQADLGFVFGDDAIFTHANLCEAGLWGGYFRGAQFYEAGLYAIRRPGDMRETDLRGADLRKADLGGTDLRGAKLRGALLSGAIYDADTKWPRGFSPQKAGARPGFVGRTEDAPCPGVPHHLTQMLDNCVFNFLGRENKRTNPGARFRWPSYFLKPIALWATPGPGPRPQGRGWRLTCDPGAPGPRWEKERDW